MKKVSEIKFYSETFSDIYFYDMPKRFKHHCVGTYMYSYLRQIIGVVKLFSFSNFEFEI